jgi:hypothetical protein
MKTNGEKMSAFRLSMIFMKTNELNASFQDVDEKKGLGEYDMTSNKWLVTRNGLSTKVERQAEQDRLQSFILSGRSEILRSE